MELWNEYEGSTIAGSFRLERLLRPEGRSAFFSTTLSDGRQTVIRLIESHYDDDAIVARWDAVAALKQEHLLGLTKFGHVVMDDTSLVYVVMEPSDADLGQVLRERALTVVETRQLAESLVGAVVALHGIGMVHEHLQPIHVLAVGETVKLRSDCIREAPEGAEGEAARNRDVYDLCLLLLQALTLDRNPDRVLKPAANSSALPTPFREILYNVLSGQWTTAAQVAKALAESATPTPAAGGGLSAGSARASATASATTASGGAAARTTSAASPASTYPAATAPGNPPGTRAANGAGIPTGRGVQAAAQANTPVYRSPVDRIHVEAGRVEAGRTEVGRSSDRDFEADGPQRSLLVKAGLVAAGLVALFLLFWYLMHRHPANHAAAQPAMQTLASMKPAAATAATPRTSATTSQTTARAARPRLAPVAAPVDPPNANADWRVIAFTYNQTAQAQTKADRLAQRNPSLHFEVFSPRGHAPYLVAVNGYMTRDQAMTLRNQLRGRGFPRDLYAQNFARR